MRWRTAPWPSSRREDPERGLTLFFRYWKETGRFESAVRSAYGITQGQFEEIWRARTRRRYGGLALAADLSIAAAVTLFIVMPFYVIRRRRDRLRMAALVRADEEAERRERESVIEALLRSISSADDRAPVSRLRRHRLTSQRDPRESSRDVVPGVTRLRARELRQRLARFNPSQTKRSPGR